MTGTGLNGTKEESTPRAPALVDQLTDWLERFFARLRFPGPNSHLPPRTLVVVTFDESDFEADYQPDLASAYDGPNQIYTVLLGDCVEPGFEEEGYNHYSLLRTIEVNFGLDHLGKNDAGANWFQFLWGRHFEWGQPQSTPVSGTEGPLAAAGFAGALFVASAVPDATVRVRTRSAGQWSSEEEALPIDGSGGLAMASTFAELVLVARSASGALHCMTYDLQGGWLATSTSLADASTNAFALASFAHQTKTMLVFHDGSGGSWWRIRSESAWSDPVRIPSTQPAEALALGALGESVFLIETAPATGSINVRSFNTAPFNVVSVPPNPYGGAQDNTTVDTWSPCAFPVAHFSFRPDAESQRRPEARVYETSGPMVVTTLDGVMHLVHPGPDNPLLLTETFSLAGVMTPSQPVSYKSADSPTASNGFGTLVEAGWSRQSPIFGTRCEAGGALAIASAGDEIVLLHRSSSGSPVELSAGRYVGRNH